MSFEFIAKRAIFLFSFIFTVSLYADITGIITPPAGNNGEVQFNKRQSFGSDPDFTFSTTTNRLSIDSILVSSIVFRADGSTQTTASSGGGVSGGGAINASTQYNVPYYSVSGSSTTLSGDSDFQFDGTGVSIGTTPLANYSLRTAGGITIGQSTHTLSWNSDQGGLHMESPFGKTSATSGGYGSIKIFSNDDHAGVLQGTLALRTSSTAGLRGVTLESIEQGTAYRSLFMNPNGGYVLINTTSPPIGSAGVGLQIHQAADKNLVFDTGGVTLAGAAGISAVNDGGTANVPIEVRASAVAFTAGSVAVGNLSPTAKLHLTAGGANVGEAALKFTSGTYLNSPVGGTVEYDGTNLYLTQESGPTRRYIAMSSGSLSNTILATDSNGIIVSTTVTGGAGGDITDVNAGSGISVSNPTGPAPSVALDLGSTNTWTANTTISSHTLTIDGTSPAFLIRSDGSSNPSKITIYGSGFGGTGSYIAISTSQSNGANFEAIRFASVGSDGQEMTGSLKGDGVLKSAFVSNPAPRLLLGIGFTPFIILSSRTYSVVGNVNITTNVFLNGSQGSDGQVLTSSGSNLPPYWSTPAGSGDAVLAASQTWTGGNTHRSSSTFQGNIYISSGLVLNGSQGSNGQVLTSSGANLPPYWSTPSASGGGGYAVEPATVTFLLDKGMTASTGTFTSSVTVTGAIGIGTTNPQRKLHIVGTDGTVGTFPTIGAREQLVIENNQNSYMTFISSGNLSGGVRFYNGTASTLQGYVNYDNAFSSMTIGTGGSTVVGVSTGAAVFSSTSTYFLGTGGVTIDNLTASKWVKTDSNKKLTSATNVVSFGTTFDGGGSALTTGNTNYIYIPYAGTITEWTLIADTTGSVVIDVKKCNGYNCNPTTSIAGSEKPTLSSAWAGQDSSLSTWTTTVTAGDKFGFNVDSASTLTRATLVIKIEKD